MSGVFDEEGSTTRAAPEGSDPTMSAAELNLTVYALHQLAERYDVLSEVGRGGMGIVYKARDGLTGELVALKILKPDIALDEVAIERFKNELRLARRITHKNVCRTHEFLLFGETAVIVMEYVEGDSLRRILSLCHGLSLRCGREWAKQICEAVAEAHAQGVVHRDLKPENILITRDGLAKVMDFGIARGLGSSDTETGVVTGTPGYMSPEQAEGKPTDARSDIYSLGLIVYEMFTGERAFRLGASIPEVLEQMRTGPPAARSIEPDLPPHIEQALRRCLEYDPKRRFQSVMELNAALAGEAVTSLEQLADLPRYLATGHRSDPALFLLAGFGLAGFLLLANSIFPETDIRLRLTREMALDRARQELLQRGCAIATPSFLMVETDDDPYNLLAERFGYEAGRRALQIDFPPIVFETKLPETMDSAGLLGDVVVYDSAGSLRSVELPAVQCVRPGAGIPREQAIELAKDEVQRTFHVDTNNLTLEPQTPLALGGRRGNSFRWLKPDVSQIARHYQVDIFDRPTLVKWSYALPDNYPAKGIAAHIRAQSVVILWSIFAFILFLTRRLYSQVQPRLLAVLALLGLVYAAGQAVSVPLSLPIRFVSFLLLAAIAITWLIIVSAAVVSVMQRRWPYSTANYVRLIRLQPEWRATGLALARGIGCGLILLGVCSVLWRLGIWSGLTWPRFGQYGELGSPFPSLTSLVHVFESALVPAYMLGLLISLIRRWVAATFLLCVIGGVLWVTQNEFSFLPRDWFLVLPLLMQGIAFCWVLIKFDLLTLLATTLTFFLWWHGYPLAVMQESLQGPERWLSFGVWGAVLAWSAFVGFRPLWARYGRRLAEALG